MENNYTVYKHIFPNNKVYIGITKQDVKKRWLNGKGYKLCPLMNKAIQKYKWENINHIILFENLTKQIAEQKEIELIAFYKSNNRKYGYNIENGGNVCGTHSKETKRKIGIKSKGNKHCLGRNITEYHIKKLYEGRIKKYKDTGKYGFCGFTHTKEYKEKMSNKLTGIKRTEETRNKISQSKKGNKYCVGRILTQETKNKIGKANRGRKLTDEQKEYFKKISIKKRINQYDLNGNFIRQWESQSEASRQTGIFEQNIHKVCIGKQKYAKGFLWRYADE